MRRLLIFLAMFAATCWGQSRIPAAGSNTNFGNLETSGPDPVIDVTSPVYGADPTGSADSLAAVEAALTAACATSPSGAIVWFPPGTYKFTNIIPNTAAYWCSGLHILGSGVRTTVLSWTGGSGYAINVRGGTNTSNNYRDVKVGGFTMDLTGATNLGGVFIGDYFFNHRYHDIYILGGNTNTGRGFSTFGDTFGTFLELYNFRIDGYGGTGAFGFDFQMSNAGDLLYCHYCYSNAAYNGIHIIGWWSATLDNSDVDNSTHEGFYLSPGTGETIIGTALSGEVNTGNLYFINNKGTVILTNPKGTTQNSSSSSFFPFEINNYSGDLTMITPVTTATGGSATASLDISGSPLPHSVTIVSGAQFLDKGLSSGANTYLNQGQGNILSNGNGGISLLTLSNPATPTVTPTCTGTCASTWGYKVVGLDAVGATTAASTQGTTAANATTLDSTHYNTVTWAVDPGVVTFNVYRTASGGTPANLSLVCTGETIGNILSCKDDGTVNTATATPSATNNTGVLNITRTTNQIITGASTNLTTLSFPASSGAVTLTFPITTNFILGAASDTTTTHVLHATAVAGVGAFSAIVAGDLPSTLTSGTAITNAALTTPNIGAATGTSLLATGIVDGKAPVTVTTGISATLGAATYQSGYTFNQEATAATGVTYTLPATAVGLQYCVKNSIVSGTGAADTGVLTVYPPASSFVILNGVRNTIGGGGTHGVASGGAAGDAACFVAVDATDWEVYVQKGVWTAN